MASLPSVTVTSMHAPTITWRCATCHRAEVFTCSDRFRTNSNGKLVDIWLIYRCRRCDATKNITVIERTRVRDVSRDLLRAAERNDPAMARRLARNIDLLRRSGAAVNSGDRWTLLDVDGALSDPLPAAFRLVFPEPLLVRLDAVVSAVTRRPRRVVRSVIRLPEATPRVDALRLWSTLHVDLDPFAGTVAPTRR